MLVPNVTLINAVNVYWRGLLHEYKDNFHKITIISLLHNCFPFSISDFYFIINCLGRQPFEERFMHYFCINFSKKIQKAVSALSMRPFSVFFSIFSCLFLFLLFFIVFYFSFLLRLDATWLWPVPSGFCSIP